MRRALCAALLAVLVLSGCGEATNTAMSRPDGPPIRIGTKNFPEQFILGELYAQALRAEGYAVRLKPDIGNSEITHQALTGGALDMYPEYIGVLLSEIADRPERPTSPRAAYALAKAFEERNGFTLTRMTPFTDSNALAVTPEFARRLKVRSIGDLGRVGGVTIGAPPEFRTRFEGLIGLRRRYGLDNVRAVPLPIGEQYGELRSGAVDAAAVFTTDGQLADGRYVILEDPRGVFADQHLAPVISQRTLRAHGPQLARTLDAVSRRLNTDAMRRMNAAVVLEQRTPRAVADEFLRQQALK
jgi:osmoprotectant transport system substrate-binding protein